MPVLDLASVGVLLILAGFAVLVVSTLSGKTDGERRVRGGGVVMIGPIPLVFGSDMKWASVTIVLAIVLIIVTFVLFGFRV